MKTNKNYPQVHLINNMQIILHQKLDLDKLYKYKKNSQLLYKINLNNLRIIFKIYDNNRMYLILKIKCHMYLKFIIQVTNTKILFNQYKIKFKKMFRYKIILNSKIKNQNKKLNKKMSKKMSKKRNKTHKRALNWSKKDWKLIYLEISLKQTY